MSEKEQTEALKLLSAMVAAFKGRTMTAAEMDLIRKAEAFLKLPVVATDVEVESHGQRRS